MCPSSEFKSSGCKINKCVICFNPLKPTRFNFNKTYKNNSKKLYDIGFKYLHSNIAKELIANISTSNDDEYPALCEKCYSSVVGLVDLNDKLEIFQKSVTDAAFIFSLEILHRRRESGGNVGNENIKTERRENEVKLVEVDISVFPNFDVDSPASKQCSSAMTSLPLQKLDTKSLSASIGDPAIVAISSNNIQIPVSSVVKVENFVASDSEDVHIETGNFSREINSSHAVENIVEHAHSSKNPLEKHLLKSQIKNSKSYVELKRLSSEFISKAVSGKIQLSAWYEKQKIGPRKGYLVQKKIFTKEKPFTNNLLDSSDKLCPRKRGRPRKQSTQMYRSNPSAGNLESSLHTTAAPIKQLQNPIKKGGGNSTKCDFTCGEPFAKGKIEMPLKSDSMYVNNSLANSNSSWMEKDSGLLRKSGRRKRQTDRFSISLAKNLAIENYGNSHTMEKADSNKCGRPCHPSKRERPTKFTTTPLSFGVQSSPPLTLKKSKNPKVEIAATSSEMHNITATQIPTTKEHFRRRKNNRPKKKIPNTEILKIKSKHTSYKKKIKRACRRMVKINNKEYYY